MNDGAFPLPKPSLVAAMRAWNRFWFRPASPTLLGLIRIVAGALALYVHLAYTVDLQELFGANAWLGADGIRIYRHEQPVVKPNMNWTPPPLTVPRDPEEKRLEDTWGVQPDQVIDQGTYTWSIWFHVTDPTAMAIIHGIVLVSFFFFTIGFCTPVTSVLSWLGALSYFNRSPTSLFGMDTMMNILLIYLIVGQSGAALSIDRLIQRYVRTRRALRAGRTNFEDDVPAPRIASNLGLRLIQVNLCFIYFTSGLSKLMGPAWWQLNAVWGTIANPEFSPLYFEPFYALMGWLCRHRLIWEIAISGSSAFTLFVEISFMFLIWSPRWRFVMIGMALMMHAGIAILMGLNTFSLMMAAMLFAFIPGGLVEAGIRRIGRNGRRLTLVFDPASNQQCRAAALARALDAWHQVAFEPRPAFAADREAVSPCSPVLADQQGHEWQGPEAFRALISSLVLTRPLRWFFSMPGLRLLGRSFDSGIKTPAPKNGARRQLADLNETSAR